MMDEPPLNTMEKVSEQNSEGSGESEKLKPDVQPSKKCRENKGKKKEADKSGEVLKALSSLGTSEEKLGAMCKKYAEMVDENRKLQAQVKQSEKKVVIVQREKEQLQTEHSKVILTRSRLENLCRELQKQNKQIKDESLQRIREEEERRKTVSNKFQSTLGEITVLMQQNNENNSKLRDENLEMQKKFKTVCEQYELREQQVEKMSKQMQLESQLAEAKLAKLKIEMVTEKEQLENDKKQLLIELAAYQHKCQELQKTEAALNSQINMYNEKYDKFQEALAKSNQLYNGFKGEIKNMSKKIAKLEKETSIWKTRWENDHQALLQAGAENQQLSRQLAQLQKLCRTLQGDRTSLLMQLKIEGITPKLPGDQNSTETSSQEFEEKTQSNHLTPETESVEKEVKLDRTIKTGNQGVATDGNIITSEHKEEKDNVKGAEEPINGEKVKRVVNERGEGDVLREPNDRNRPNDEVVEKCKDLTNTNSNSKAKKGKEGAKKR